MSSRMLVFASLLFVHLGLVICDGLLQISFFDVLFLDRACVDDHVGII